MAKIQFTKMQGIGNDFIIIDCRKFDVRAIDNFAFKLCDRRFGIGADQALLLEDSGIADFKMAIFNADGSEVEMCGNGIRCFAKYLLDRGLTIKKKLEIETLAGIIKPEIVGDGVRVDMGVPILEGRNIPVNFDGNVINYPLMVDNHEFRITAVSMGNPHCVTFVDDVDKFDLERFGPLFERHPFFPKRVNFEIVQILNVSEIKMRVFERGSGETLACGTGACACAVASYLNRKSDENVTVHLRGGDLKINLSENKRVFMTGPATEVFNGEINL